MKVASPTENPWSAARSMIPWYVWPSARSAMKALNLATNSSLDVVKRTPRVTNVPRRAGMNPIRKMLRITRVLSERTAGRGRGCPCR